MTRNPPDAPAVHESRRVSLIVGDLPDGLNLRHVYYFHAVAMESSIASASRRLGVSQSTISEQVKALEEFFGGALFERRKGGLMLTAAGARVFEHSQNIFKAARRMLQDLKPDLDRRAWVLEVGMSPAPSRTLATRHVLPLFRLDQVFPRVRLGTNGALLEDLLSGELDLVISENAVTEGHRTKIGSRTLREHPLAVVASPELASTVEGFPGGLGTIPFVNYTRNSRYRWDLDGWFAQQGLAPNVVGEAEDPLLLAALAEEGSGAVAVPTSVVEAALSAKRLVQLGTLNEVRSVVYVHFAKSDTPELIRRAVETLVAAA